jgi:type IV pilus secretin PilQ/predicted competence protein
MRGRMSRLVMAAPMAVALAMILVAGSEHSVAGYSATAPALRSVSSRLDGTVSTVLIEASEPVAYLTSQPDPLTVLVDLRNVRASELSDHAIASTLAPVASVTVEEGRSPDGSPSARVKVSLDRAAKHRVRSARNVIRVEVDGAMSTALATAPTIAFKKPVARIAPAPAPPARSRTVAAAAAAPATELRSVKAVALPEGFAISLAGNGRLVASSVEEARDLPARLLLDFNGVTAGRAPAVTMVNQGDIKRVRVAVNSREPLITRVVIDLARKLPYTVESVGDDLRVLFNRAVEAVAAVVKPAAPTAEPEPTPAPAAPAPTPAAVEPAPQASVAGPAAEIQAAAIEPPASQPAGTSMAATMLASAQSTDAQQRRFTGHPVTLDFQGADLRAVLRTFSEISGLNMVIDPSINGTVDVSLREVPWDQALDIILKANKLGYIVDGTVVRIVPLSVLAQENEEVRKLTDARALSGELRIMTRPLSYAKAADLVPIVTKSSLSSRGDVQVDARTNTLIIRDLADRLTSASDLIATLDRPQPQVEIEARIVQTSRDFAKQLGVQWGFNGRMDPALGNTTGLAFPNSVNAGGRLGTVQGANNAPTGVNLAAPAPSNAIGIALGSINGALNLDVALSALERTGKGRILSTPRVSTQNNVAAEIMQGTQIPIQTVANNTVTVSFKDAALTLKVTPQITAAHTVIMQIAVENSQANFGRQVNGIPPIDTQKASTTVLVADGDTTVIGGIYERTETSSQNRTPMLHRVPLLGWLFKQDVIDEKSSELLIFITPRITRE